MKTSLITILAIIFAISVTSAEKNQNCTNVDKVNTENLCHYLNDNILNYAKLKDSGKEKINPNRINKYPKIHSTRIKNRVYNQKMTTPELDKDNNSPIITKSNSKSQLYKQHKAIGNEFHPIHTFEYINTTSETSKTKDENDSPQLSLLELDNKEYSETFDNITFNLSGTINSSIYDINGSLIKKISGNTSLSISKNDLSSGVYFIVIESGNKVATKKIIVQK